MKRDRTEWENTIWRDGFRTGIAAIAMAVIATALLLYFVVNGNY